MTATLVANLDYIQFVYGLGLVLFAITLLGLRSTVASPLPWKWLGISALFLGLSAWTDMLSVSAGHRTGEDALRVVLFVAGSAFLVEFARTCWAAVGGRAFGRWIVFVLIVLAALGGFAGLSGVDATAGYVLGLVGGLWSAAGLARYQRAGGQHGRPLLLAAAAMALFVVAGCAGTLKASAPPALWINEEWFFLTTGFPVQLLLMALAAPFIAGLWLHYRALLRDQHPGVVDRRGTVRQVAMLAALVVIIAAGFYATSLTGKRWDAGARANLLTHTALVAQAIDPNKVVAQTAAPADVSTPAYGRLRQQLIRVGGASREIRWFDLLAQTRAGIVLIADGMPLADPERGVPGTLEQHPPARLVELLTKGGDLTIGPYAHDGSVMVSAFVPIRDAADGRVVGVLGLDVDAAGWAHSLAGARAVPIFVTLLFCLVVIVAYVVQERLRLVGLALWESARDYRAVLDSMQNGFFRADENGDLLMVSPSFARIFGLPTATQAVGRNLARDFYEDPDDRAAFLDALKAGGGELVDYEVTLKRVDGTPICVSTTCHYYRDISGNVRGVEGVARDITERKRAEAALRESRDRLDFVLKSAEVGAWDWDIAAGVERWDETVVALYGMAPGVLQGSGDALEQYVHPDDRAAVEAALGRCVATGAAYDVEFRVTRNGGAVAYVAERGRVTRDAAGKPVRMSGVTWDITRRKMTEKSLHAAKEETEAANRELELVAQRANQLALEAESANSAQERVPGQHEPRDPHADERRDRHDLAAARHRPRCRAAGLRAHGAEQRRGAAHDPQRHPRLLQDRGREARDGDIGLRPAPHGGGHVRPAGAARPEQGTGAHRDGRCRRPRGAARRPRTPAPGPYEPDRQRGEVHRTRRGGGLGGARGGTGDRSDAALRGARHRGRAWRRRSSTCCSRRSRRPTPPPRGDSVAPVWA